jgi:hypothetical protein
MKIMFASCFVLLVTFSGAVFAQGFKGDWSAVLNADSFYNYGTSCGALSCRDQSVGDNTPGPLNLNFSVRQNKKGQFFLKLQGLGRIYCKISRSVLSCSDTSAVVSVGEQDALSPVRAIENYSLVRGDDGTFSLFYSATEFDRQNVVRQLESYAGAATRAE